MYRHIYLIFTVFSKCRFYALALQQSGYGLLRSSCALSPDGRIKTPHVLNVALSPSLLHRYPPHSPVFDHVSPGE